ncbi:tripartite tricarboxylate transporter substrate binding protein [Ammoniphilus sp. YIM 78166]|uniref:tripartite tricarboxylate transporter substrate binding protein n=1 Tax=Ammoniphilus sp. YIM 78166 TaxID=1644106 RepID=UPI001070438B|nr:tripartite tricarboxylate transporter substrate binding protein [Ammoniphilus sp. YIM 78166]
MNKNKFVSSFLSVAMVSVLALTGCGGNNAAGNATGNNGTENTQSEAKLDYPKKPITIINPFAAGGAADTTSRVLAQHAEQFIGHSLVIENRDGGGGSIGQTAGASAKPDGYTLTLVTASIVSNPIFNQLTYTHESFEPIIMTVNDPLFLVVNKNAPFQDAESFVQYAKENPGKVRIGVSGAQTTNAFANKELAEKANIDLVTVPFKGDALSIAAAAGGHVEGVVASYSGVESQVNSGELKAILVFDEQKSELAPEVPTAKEKGYDVIGGSWRGVAAPKGTDPQIIEYLHNAFKQATETPEYQEQMKKSGINPSYKDPAGFKTMIDDTFEKYSKYAEK